MIVGIDATNLRRGGGITHLVELLSACEPANHGFAKVIVWGGTLTLDKLIRGTKGQVLNVNSLVKCEKSFRLIFVGRLIEQKNILNLIHALALLSREYTWQLNVYGEGDQKNARY